MDRFEAVGSGPIIATLVRRVEQCRGVSPRVVPDGLASPSKVPGGGGITGSRVNPERPSWWYRIPGWNVDLVVCNVDQPPSTHIGSPGTVVAEDDVFGVVVDDIVAGCVVDNVFDRHIRRP